MRRATLGALSEVTAAMMEALRESEARFRTICEHAPVMLDAFDAGGRVMLWNRQCVSTLGYTFDEVAAHPDPISLFYPETQLREQVKQDMALGDGLFREYQVRTRSGATRLQLWANFRLPTGALLSVGHDITQQRAVEERVRHTQKLDALGQLSGGIAHDFNNLLSIIMANAGLLRRRLADDPRNLELVEEILKTVRRGAGLADKLQAFSRREQLEPQSTDVVQFVAEFVPTLRRMLPSRIAVELSLPDENLLSMIDHSSVEQILLNLATNARDAIEGDGRISITVRKRSGYVVLAVEDDGIGMDSAAQGRAFDPFFTTKERSQGTGLGLSMVYGLVAQHEGRTELTSRTGHGTTVEVCFPLESRNERLARGSTPAPTATNDPK